MNTPNTPEERQSSTARTSRVALHEGHGVESSDLDASSTELDSGRTAEDVPASTLAERREVARESGAPAPNEARAGALEPLFPSQLAEEFRARWIAVQGSFVDDPQRAVQQADELVVRVMRSLADTFESQRAHLESDSRRTGDATETLRVTLRRYRSFFERLLAL